MSVLGKSVRLNRLFSDPSGRILTIAVDHMINYPVGMPDGLKRIQETVDRVVEARPSAITLNKGAAIRCFAKHAGKVPLIIQQMALTPGRLGFADHATVEEAVALGADAIAVAMFVKGEDELPSLRHLSAVVRAAERFGLPVIPHIYPVVPSSDGSRQISHLAEDVFYAVRAGMEMGADIVKAPYTGDVESYADVVRATPIPVVSAGGPKCATLNDAVRMIEQVRASGAAGSTVGRNAWGFPDIGEAIGRLKAAMFKP